MASVTKVETSKGTRYRARYRDPEGRSREQWFDKERDARQFLVTVEHKVLTGGYVDPNAGRVLFTDFAATWVAAQVWEPTTQEAMEVRLRKHLDPHFGAMELRQIKPSTVQAWMRSQQARSAPRHCAVLLANLSAILGAAVEDELIHRNPCSSSAVRAPRVDNARIVPWTPQQIAAVADAMPQPYRAIVALGAGCGLRQGECFGLRVQDVDFLRRTVQVRQQVRIVRSKVEVAAPKRGKQRDVPLPAVVATELTQHMAERGLAADDGERLLLLTREGNPIHRTHFNRSVWKPALERAGVAPTRGNGMHALRHHYASVLLDGGVSVRALADYLGHEDPGFTLRVYAHMLPEAEGRVRSVVEAAFAHAQAEPGVPRMLPFG